MTKGPIIIVDDDTDDQELYAEVIKNIGIPNQIRFFRDGRSALQYLSTTADQPFLILSDVNMPQMNGLEFKQKIQSDDYLREKGIPFVFVSTNADASIVRKAHILSVQGYFEKPATINGITAMLKNVFNYWELCKHINNI
jgi:CheY-like chemotaxis protein